MGLDVAGLVNQTIQSAGFSLVANNPLAQFGTLPAREYKLASLLPERLVPVNNYTEEAIRYRTLIANNGSRYSPVQIKGGALTGSFQVRLANSGIGSPFTASDYDAVLRILRQSQGQAGILGGGIQAVPEMQAMVQAGGMLAGWGDLTLLRPLLEWNELMRAQAINRAAITLTGDNNYTETVVLPNPLNHRVAAGGQWSNNTYDPYLDIMAMNSLLASRGYTVTRMICGTDVRTILSNNAQIKARVGRISVTPGTNSVANVPAGYVNLARLNEEFSADGLPPLETYDLQYATSTATGFFWDRGTFTMIATTGRNENIDLGDLQPMPDPAVLARLGLGLNGNGQAVVQNTIGYTAIGTVAGHGNPGRVMNMIPQERHPMGIHGEAIQESLAVLTDPESVGVINTIY